MINQEKTNFFEDNHMFGLKNDLTLGIIGNISFKIIDNTILYEWINELCPNTFSTIFYHKFVKHIQSYHKITSWDGMCEICRYGFWKKSCMYMENALEHLFFYHLIIEYKKKNVYNTLK